MSKRYGANLLPKLRLSIVAAFATIFLALALSPWSAALAEGLRVNFGIIVVDPNFRKGPISTDSPTRR